MNTHYLIDLFSDAINDVVTARNTPPTTQMTGNYVVRLSYALASATPPVDLADLLTQKYAAILTSHGLFTQIAYDSLLDSTGVDFASSNGVISGLKGHVGLYPKTNALPIPVLQTAPYGLTWAGPGAGPSQALLMYEVFKYVDVDPAKDPFQRSYQELASDVDVTVQVSFDGGVTFMNAKDQSIISIGLAARGTQLVVKFTRETKVDVNDRVFLGSWAILY